MQDDLPSKPASAAAVSSSAARVWITAGLPVSAAIVEEPLEEPALRVVRRVVAEVVEADLADGDRLRMVEQLAELGDGVVVASAAACGWMPRIA